MMAERNISLSNWPGTVLWRRARAGPCAPCLDIQAAFEQPLHQRLVALHRQCQLASGQQPPQWSYGQPDPCGGISDKKHTWPLTDSQGTRFLWTDRAANSTEERLFPRTATGGQAHARLSRCRQMSPDERTVRGPSQAPKSLRSPFGQIISLVV